MKEEMLSGVRFVSLASGSSGNCYYLGNEHRGILIDAGIPVRTITKALKSTLGITLESGHIQGVIVTHEHADHVRAVGGLASNYHIPIYASVQVHNSIATCRFIQEKLGGSRRNLELGQALELADFEITTFLVPHDSVLNYGYHIRWGDIGFTFATDVGHVTPELRYYASSCDYLVVEANYDPEMLRAGNYPDFLKMRVASDTGHLSNIETAQLLTDIYSPRLKHVWLCHLSKENNHPDLCWKTIEARMYYDKGVRVGRTDEQGRVPSAESKDMVIDVLARTRPSVVYHL